MKITNNTDPILFVVQVIILVSVVLWAFVFSLYVAFSAKTKMWWKKVKDWDIFEFTTFSELNI